MGVVAGVVDPDGHPWTARRLPGPLLPSLPLGASGRPLLGAANSDPLGTLLLGLVLPLWAGGALLRALSLQRYRVEAIRDGREEGVAWLVRGRRRSQRLVGEVAEALERGERRQFADATQVPYTL